jgi:hypothetical protein
MSFTSIAQMAGDAFLRERITACAAVEGERDPAAWAATNSWAVAAQPGWAAKWDSAVAAGNVNPGRDPAVITDADITAGVQAVQASLVPPTQGARGPVQADETQE